MPKSKVSKIKNVPVLEGAKLHAPEARCLVSNYYAAQDMRKRSDQQLSSLGDKKELPVLNFMGVSFKGIEESIKKQLEAFARSNPDGQWLLDQHGVGAIIAAGLIAHLDITKAPTAGHFWSFAGLDRTRKWEKGEKRPYNADLKQICFHLGECIVRTHNHPDSFYGRIYEQRKEYEVNRNESGGNAERAKTYYTKSKDVKKTLAKGKLPDGQVDRQARWYAVKMFLSHLHHVMYWNHYKCAPPKPFIIEHGGHAHFIEPPGFTPPMTKISSPSIQSDTETVVKKTKRKKEKVAA